MAHAIGGAKALVRMMTLRRCDTHAQQCSALGSATDPAADVQGDEAGPDARVWRVYLDESAKLDEDMLQGYRESLDVHIIFVRRRLTSSQPLAESDIHRPPYSQPS